jgi:hypothetical protein
MLTRGARNTARVGKAVQRGRGRQHVERCLAKRERLCEHGSSPGALSPRPERPNGRLVDPGDGLKAFYERRQQTGRNKTGTWLRATRTSTGSGGAS